MENQREQEKTVTLLGSQDTKYPDNYAPEVLETFLNKHPENDYFVKFNCPEFTSLCPITGQPDFFRGTLLCQVNDPVVLQCRSAAGSLETV